MVTCRVPRLPALPVCLMLLQLLSPCSAEFAVVGPPEPIVAVVGEDAELPCHLSPEMSAETLQLTWERRSPMQVVHRYAHGQEHTPTEDFRGRTSILREDVTAGKAALQIRNVSVSDNGTYVCYFRAADFYAKAQVELQVAALGSDPRIEMKGYEAGGIRLICTSAGWYPLPHIQWRDAGGQSVPSETADVAADPQGLYAASASVVLKEGSGWVSCVIRNPLLGQERSAGLSIPGDFCRDTVTWMVLFFLTLSSFVVLLLGVLYMRWRQQKKTGAPAQDTGTERGLREKRRGRSGSGSKAPTRSCRRSSSQEHTPDRVDLLPRDPEYSSAASSTAGTPLLGPRGAAVAPSEDPEGGVGLQAAVPAGGRATPEQALQTEVPPGTQSRPGQQRPQTPGSRDSPGGRPGVSSRNKFLPFSPQQYEEKYVLKDGSPEAMNRIYLEFANEVPRSNWGMFMRLAGLEENDIVVCEHENPGNLPEQHHRMLLRWQSKLGRAATPFRLMAALCKLRLRECLENIINKLLAEDILGSKDAEPPN